MFDDSINPATLRPQELEAVYAISRAVARAVNLDRALDEIARIARPVFIFDNMVLYLPGSDKALESVYARAIGRGRSREAELVWGEATGQKVIQSGQVCLLREEMGNLKDRTRLRFSLGLPIEVNAETTGALVFIRFGGPAYEPDQIRVAEFIAGHIVQFLEHDQLVQRIAKLEAERRLDRLQEDFIATVSHELLTPLGFIKGYATTLLREDKEWDDSTQREFLTIIDEEADRLHELIDNLMDSSRLQAGTLRMSFQPVRLDTFVRDVSARAKARDDIQSIQLKILKKGIKIPADPARLAQVFDNLLSNAAKYAPGSPITISVDRIGKIAQLVVRDEGPGIPTKHLDHLFKRFYRVPSNNTTVRGTGLGLFICRQIVRAHGGEIRVESVLGEGTTFYITLPMNIEQKKEQISLRESTI